MSCMKLAHGVDSYITAAILQSIVQTTHGLWSALKKGCGHAWERREVFESMVFNVVKTFETFIQSSRLYYDNSLIRTDEDRKNGVHVLVVEFASCPMNTNISLTVRSDEPRDRVGVAYKPLGEPGFVGHGVDVFHPEFMSRGKESE